MNLRAAVLVSVAILGGRLCGATLQDRIDAAPPGAVLELTSGTYSAPIVISKPLTIVGHGLPLVKGNGKGKVIRVEADDVTVRGLRLAGSGLNLLEDDAAIHVTGNRVRIEENVIEDSLHGIYLKKVQDSQVLNNRICGKTSLTLSNESVEDGLGKSGAENCESEALVANRRGNGIHQWNCERTRIIGNEVQETRDGIYFSFSNHSWIENNRVHHVRYGLHYMYSDQNQFVGNTFSENAAGAAIMFSKGLVVRSNRFVDNRGHRAYGIILQSTDDSRLEDNEIEHNAVGIAFNQCNRNVLVGNSVSSNYIGVRFSSNSDENAFSENRFHHNLHPVEIAGDGLNNRWAINGVGNYWDDSAGFDLDQDGVEDLPHRELDLFGILRRDFPAIAFLSESPLTTLLGFANQRVAIPGTNSIQDPAPLGASYWNRKLWRMAQTGAPRPQGL